MYDDATEIQNPDLLHPLFKLELWFSQLQPEESMYYMYIFFNFVNKRAFFP